MPKSSHKTVCPVCKKEMRCDNIGRHMKTHPDPVPVIAKEIEGPREEVRNTVVNGEGPARSNVLTTWYAFQSFVEEDEDAPQRDADAGVIEAYVIRKLTKTLADNETLYARIKALENELRYG